MKTNTTKKDCSHGHTFRGMDDLHWNCIRCGIPSKPNQPDQTSDWEEEFNKLTEQPDLDLVSAGKWLKETKTLFTDDVYVESMYELDEDKVKEFIKNLLDQQEQRHQRKMKEDRKKILDEVMKCLEYLAVDNYVTGHKEPWFDGVCQKIKELKNKKTK